MKHSLPYDHYYRYQEIADLLHGYEKDHPELFQLSVIGRTPQGRDILACTITNTATGNPEDKPAIIWRPTSMPVRSPGPWWPSTSWTP